MTDTNDPVPTDQPDAQPVASPAPPPYASAPAPATVPAPAAQAPVPGYYQAGPAPLGKIRGTGGCILLTIVTLGFYTWYWYYKTHDEMKRHSGQGLGGAIALILIIFVSIVMPYINSSEVGALYERTGRKRPVSGATGLWYFPGMFILVGPIIWFVKTNGALNDYWRTQGAQG